MDFKAAEIDCLNHLEADALPFHDLYRSLYGYEQQMPDQRQFDNALELFESLTKDHKLKVLLALEKEITLRKAVETLKSAYESGKYDTVNYGIWLSND